MYVYVHGLAIYRLGAAYRRLKKTRSVVVVVQLHVIRQLGVTVQVDGDSATHKRHPRLKNYRPLRNQL
jgi:hypothetical protein